MSVTVTETITRQVAELARLELSDSEVKTFTAQLKDILGYIETLQSVDIDGVAPLIHPFELATPMREDKVIEPNGRVLDHAPDVLNGGYKVPPIL